MQIERKVLLCPEMKRFRAELDNRNIPWQDASRVISDENLILSYTMGIPANYADTTIYRTHFKYNNMEFSVINGYCTSGGYDPLKNQNVGYLELACLSENATGIFADPVGFLSTDDIFHILENEYQMH